jgi:hypothetical protein
MPIEKYDKHFGGKGGASKALAAMKKQYGDKKGEEVFYATMNKKKKKKSHAETLYGD